MTDAESARARARAIVEYAVGRRPAGILLPVAHVVEVLAAFDLPVVPMRAVTTVAQAADVAAVLGFPLVLRVPGSPGVEVTSPEQFVAAYPALPEVLVQASVGPTLPALMWPVAFATRVAALRAALPEIDALDLVVEVDRAGRTWIVEATAHVRAEVAADVRAEVSDGAGRGSR